MKIHETALGKHSTNIHKKKQVGVIYSGFLLFFLITFTRTAASCWAVL